MAQAYTIIDTVEKVSEMLAKLETLPVSPPSLYIDLEGVNLSRTGSISILQLYALPLHHTYLIDIHHLGASAFTTPSSDATTTTTLKSLLESPHTPKVFFDVRRDAEALYHHFNISLSRVDDLQLLELAGRIWRAGRGRFVNGLERCIRNDAGLSQVQIREFEARKQVGLQLFAPEWGGSYEVFNERPMRAEIVTYCVQDVEFLPILWRKYHGTLTPLWERKIKEAVEQRLALARTEVCFPEGSGMARGPW
ncbi:ribonuclease H-like domain-containing protein [Sphaerosporella brunnea]|uniref:Ribonuclease H-like domain-containing protein n=1 Tax=Sphaerosporella brunnea TaxID=1250544 RepID=A0A5J5F0N2_9PEZI|nr:ribonuclease H-like domain-containing protein [Sphaerosporella brunnea]